METSVDRDVVLASELKEVEGGKEAYRLDYQNNRKRANRSDTMETHLLCISKCMTILCMDLHGVGQIKLVIIHQLVLFQSRMHPLSQIF